MEPIDDDRLSAVLRKWEVASAPPSLEARVFRIARRLTLWRRWGPVLALPVTAAFALLLWTLHMREASTPPPPALPQPPVVSAPLVLPVVPAPAPVPETKKTRPAKRVPPRPAISTAPQALHIDAQAAAGRIVEAPRPVLPPDVRVDKFQSVLKLQIRIGKDGHVMDATVVSGDPVLASAAVEAVKQWLYRPTLLNGEAVEVVTEVEVQFSPRPRPAKRK